MGELKYDVVIIGGGPGGYVAAIRAAQLGKSVAVVEKDTLGGVCLNWGCIPTKSLLRDAEVLHLIKNAKTHGIQISEYSFDFALAVKRSRRVVKGLSKGIEYLMKKNKIKHIHGTGVMKSVKEVAVTDADGKKISLNCDNIILATGARNKELPGLEVDGRRVISSKEAMVLDRVPKKMVIIGAGAIGVEFASLYNEYGAEVHLVEMLPHVLPLEDEDISAILKKSLERQGIKTNTSTRVEKIEALKTKVKVHVTAGEKGQVLEGEVALLAVGVQGNVEDIGLEEVGVVTEKGWIKVNEYCETSVKGIYAIGDIIGPPWLAHVASAEGRLAAEHLGGRSPQPIDYSNIPSCTYCRPQVASLGLTEREAMEEGHEIKVGRFPLRANGKALAAAESEGIVKIIFDEKYGELLGCHIIGSEATELIAEVGIAKTLETTFQEILQTVHAHPTISEVIMEAAADAYGEAIHI